MAAERLQKYLARAGVASRRHAEELITAGRVTVNNQKVTELGSRVEPGSDLVAVDGQLVSPPETSSYFLLYKPAGVVTTLSDPQGRPTVASYVEKVDKRLFPVGRLDYDAEGALLFTDDGALAHKLTHPSFQVPRTYLSKVKGEPDVATLDKLRGGVRLEDGMATPLHVSVFEQAERNTWLKIVVAEGRPHLIKRLCAAVGHPVVRLFRPDYAGIVVSGLRPGELRPLTSAEVRLLQDVSEGKMAPPESALGLPPRRHGRTAPGFAGADEDDDFEVESERPEPAAKPPRAAQAAARKMAENPERKTAGRARTEGGSGLAKFGRTPRGSGEERKSFGARGEGSERPERKSFGARGAGGERPERKSWSPRGEGGERPERKSFGARGAGGERPERKPFGARGAGGERPERKPFGARGAGGERPERKTWSPRGEGADRPERKPFGARGAGGERPERREWKPRGEGGDRPERKAWSPRGEGSERPARKPFGARGESGDRPARKPFGAGGDRPARKPFGAGSDRPARKPFGAGGDRPERREWKPRGEGAGRPERKPFGARGEGGDRPERREWKPRGEGAGRPERKPFGGGGARPERKEWKPRGEAAGRTARPERSGSRGSEGGAGAGFTDWRKKKREPGAAWDSQRPGAGGARGPRKPGGPRRPR